MLTFRFSSDPWNQTHLDPSGRSRINTSQEDARTFQKWCKVHVMVNVQVMLMLKTIQVMLNFSHCG